ncbi:alpha/beta hydrolase [Clostridium sp. AUH-JLR23]|uniref:alpha/beta hydrolase n=1 Tax=Clostridium sp. AUH-JLR23 TaxID=1505062 RepID=UPI00356228BD
MIEKFDVYIEPFHLWRTMHVYLPDDYYQTQERYPVMYMYDGHNLFNDQDATYGKSWGLSDFLNHYDKPFIIVGMECNHEGHERLNEYCPYDVENGFFGPIQGKGRIYMDWVINDLKPMIDQKYRTIPFRECTGIGGSSMGGLMAFYTVIHYNQYFSKAACLSPAISLCTNQLLQEMKNQDFNQDTRVYWSFGSKETSNPQYFLKNIQIFNDEIVRRGGQSYIHIEEGGQHNEATWEKQNQLYFDILWK